MIEKSDVWFVYDGECPLCQIGANYYRLREQVGELHIVDAREAKDNPVMQEINAARLNMDDGMVIKYQGRLHQGDAALQLMARLGADAGIIHTAMNRLFASPVIAKCCYPFMKGARNIALMLKGAGKIRNLDV